MKKIIPVVLLVVLLFVSGCSSKSEVSTQQKQNSAEVKTESSVTPVPQNNKEVKQTEKSGTTQKSTEVKSNTNTNTNTNTSKVTPAPAEKKSESFTLVISENKGSKVISKKSIEITSKKSLMDYLKANNSVIEEGGFIKSIDGIASISSSKLTSEQKKAGVLGVDWFILLNGKKTSTGAYDVYPKSGDLINVDFKEWTYQDYGA